MKQNIVGYEQEQYYSVCGKRDENGKLRKRPHLVSERKLLETVIREDVSVPESIDQFIIDGERCALLVRKYDIATDTLIILIDHIIGEPLEVDKKKSEEELKTLLEEWNEQEISNDARLLAACRALGKEPKDVDVDDLRATIGAYNVGGFSIGLGDVPLYAGPPSHAHEMLDHFRVPKHDHNVGLYRKALEAVNGYAPSTVSIDDANTFGRG